MQFMSLQPHVCHPSSEAEAKWPQMTFSNDENINTLAPISLKRILVCAVNNKSSVVSIIASHRIGRSASHYRKQC